MLQQAVGTAIGGIRERRETAPEPPPLSSCNMPAMRHLRVAEKPHVKSTKLPKLACSNGVEHELAPGEPESFEWFHIERPSERILQQIADTVGISISSLRRSLDPDQRATTYRHRDSLVATIEEFVTDDRRPYDIRFNDLHAFVSRDHLITISSGPSPSVNWVWDEIRKREVAPEERGNTNYVLSRILGRTLHCNETVLRRLERGVKDLALATSASGARGDADRTTLTDISISVEAARHPVQATREVILALKEDSNLFGATKPRDALNRYLGMFQAMVSSVDFTRSEVTTIQRAWRELHQEETNSLLFKFAWAGALLLLPAAAFDFFQVPFQHGWTDGQMWGGLAASVIGSAVLIGGLYWKKGGEFLRTLAKRVNSVDWRAVLTDSRRNAAARFRGTRES